MILQKNYRIYKHYRYTYTGQEYRISYKEMRPIEQNQHTKLCFITVITDTEIRNSARSFRPYDINIKTLRGIDL